MPLENDFTRVFGAIKELEARVERMEQSVWSGGETVSKFEWHPYGKPDYRSLFVSEQLNSGRLLKELSDETDKRRDAEAKIVTLDHGIAIAQQVARRDLDELERQNNQLRFILSILAAVTDDGWIAWHGGRVPPVFDLVDCKLRDGWTWKRISPDRLSWAHNSWGTDIIAYRIAR
jgi:hypothetical protein